MQASGDLLNLYLKRHPGIFHVKIPYKLKSTSLVFLEVNFIKLGSLSGRGMCSHSFIDCACI